VRPRSEQPHTWLANAGRSGAFLGPQTNIAVCARSTFDRRPTGFRNPDASDLDLSATHFHGLAMPRGEPVPDQIGQHANAEPMAVQRRSGAALLP
jgi:hypothetical protein